MSEYFYLDISLEFTKPTDTELTPVYFKKFIMDAHNTLFGEAATCVNIDLLKYNEKEKRGILRVPKTSYVKLRSSLSFVHKYGTEQCYFVVHKASSLLLSLQGDSRTYNFK